MYLVVNVLHIYYCTRLFLQWIDVEVNKDVVRQNLFNAYIHHVDLSFQYAESLFNLGFGSEPASILRQMYAYGYQHGLARSNNNSNNAP